MTQNINEAFCSLTTRHFSAFFKRSLTTYGVDECTSAANRSALYSSPSIIISGERPQTKPALADVDRPVAARAVSGRRDAAQAVFGHPRPVQGPRGPSLTVEMPRRQSLAILDPSSGRAGRR